MRFEPKNYYVLTLKLTCTYNIELQFILKKLNNSVNMFLLNIIVNIILQLNILTNYTHTYIYT